MAKTKNSLGIAWRPIPTKKVTTQGNGAFSRFRSKNDKRNKKKYRGQGK